jgi:hypothetical protein
MYNLPKPIILECGTCNGYSFATDSSITFLTNSYETCIPKTLGIVSIDTNHLCNPKIKIDFSCNVHFIETDVTGIVQLEFQLFKCCNNSQHELPIGTWYFKIQGKSNQSAQSFSFIYCDCNSSPSYNQFSVRCHPIEIETASISITNCHISAIAQSGI